MSPGTLPAIEAKMAVGADLGAVRGLLAESVDSIKGKRGERVLQETLEGKDLVGNPDTLVLGEVNSVVLGFASFRIARGDASVLKVDWFYVKPEARKVGLGAAIMDQLLAIAKENDCVRIDSPSLPGDARTKNFFESFGLKATLLNVSREI